MNSCAKEKKCALILEFIWYLVSSNWLLGKFIRNCLCGPRISWTMYIIAPFNWKIYEAGENFDKIHLSWINSLEISESPYHFR